MIWDDGHNRAAALEIIAVTFRSCGQASPKRCYEGVIVSSISVALGGGGDFQCEYTIYVSMWHGFEIIYILSPFPIEREVSRAVFEVRLIWTVVYTRIYRYIRWIYIYTSTTLTTATWRMLMDHYRWCNDDWEDASCLYSSNCLFYELTDILAIHWHMYVFPHPYVYEYVYLFANPCIVGSMRNAGEHQNHRDCRWDGLLGISTKSTDPPACSSVKN